ncbi:MAG TPA: phage baseplate assembly protein V [Pseudonocardiaceae bacterium]|jgi:hypothetical protein
MTSVPGYDYHGIYEGEVVLNIDPDQRGRVLVQVTDVAGMEPVFWAEASSPVAGSGMGFYAVPAIGTTVWITFVGGDPSRAVWLGNPHETSADLPSDVITNTNPLTPPVMLYTQEGHNVALIDGLQLDGGPGGIFLRHAFGHSIEITETHIKLSFGLPGGVQSTIQLDATGVSINGTALTVSNLGV